MLKEIAYTLYSYTVAHPVQTQVIVLVALLVYYLVVYPVTSPYGKSLDRIFIESVISLATTHRETALGYSCARVA